MKKIKVNDLKHTDSKPKLYKRNGVWIVAWNRSSNALHVVKACRHAFKLNYERAPV